MICIKENLFFDPVLGLILHLKAGQEEAPVHIQLDAKLAGLFHLLLLHQGQLVPRQTFVDEVWEGNVWVGEKALTRNISRLRSLLRAHQIDDCCLIKTLPKKGYSLMVDAGTKRYPFIPTLREQRTRTLWLGLVLLLAVALMSSIFSLQVENVEEQQLILQDPNGSVILEEIVTQD
ncbi:MAG: winged helix-turn-helix domain-containing protein [Saprospiraceae bacterium]|nr:winged helix-turn-helix domain-containing protein [Saprospiraceae bacterium]